MYLIIEVALKQNPFRVCLLILYMKSSILKVQNQTVSIKIIKLTKALANRAKSCDSQPTS